MAQAFILEKEPYEISGTGKDPSKLHTQVFYTSAHILYKVESRASPEKT